MHTGHFPDPDVPTVLRALPGEADGLGHALISTVDSLPDVASLASLRTVLDEIGSVGRPLGRGVVVSRDVLLALAVDREFFNGFDEIWLFDAALVLARPAVPPITSDRTIEEVAVPSLGAWMATSGCALGLGDGDGLNVLTTDADALRAIRRIAPA